MLGNCLFIVLWDNVNNTSSIDNAIDDQLLVIDIEYKRTETKYRMRNNERIVYD